MYVYNAYIVHPHLQQEEMSNFVLTVGKIFMDPVKNDLSAVFMDIFMAAGANKERRCLPARH